MSSNQRPKILVTGANGFLGKNLISQLKIRQYDILSFDKKDDLSTLETYCKQADAVVHLAGVNRPPHAKDFYDTNTALTSQLCKMLEKHGNPAPIIFSSSIQAELDNDYGKSKKNAEDIILKHSETVKGRAFIFRFKNLYGKWSRPNYNSVVATWCHNISRGLEIKVDDEAKTIDLCYVDDAVDAIISKLDSKETPGIYTVDHTDTITLGDLRKILTSYRDTRTNFSYPNQSTRLNRNLWATYLSYLDRENFSYALNTRVDNRGSFTEILKDSVNGQISVNISKPGITKGQHWHSTKNEKFLVVHGKGVIRFRDVFESDVIEYKVSSDRLEVVDIPVGYTHNIENLGAEDMVTLMWANELYDPKRPDTNPEDV